MSMMWQKWLKLDASQLATVSAGGYYTTKVEGFPRLRILALNTDYGYELTNMQSCALVPTLPHSMYNVGASDVPFHCLPLQLRCQLLHITE